jgi:hypothetical protein
MPPTGGTKPHPRADRPLPPVLVVGEDVEVCAWLEMAAADAALDLIGK